MSGRVGVTVTGDPFRNRAGVGRPTPATGPPRRAGHEDTGRAGHQPGTTSEDGRGIASLEQTSTTGRVLARVGVVVALTVGACGAGTAAGATPPAPAPPPAPALPAAAPAPAPAPVPVEPWDSLVRCETGGDWYLDTGNGYQGGLQLSPRTWQAYGGGQFTAEADEASREHQILVGDRVRAEQGWEAWGGCSEELGLT